MLAAASCLCHILTRQHRDSQKCNRSTGFWSSDLFGIFFRTNEGPVIACSLCQGERVYTFWDFWGLHDKVLPNAPKTEWGPKLISSNTPGHVGFPTTAHRQATLVPSDWVTDGRQGKGAAIVNLSQRRRTCCSRAGLGPWVLWGLQFGVATHLNFAQRIAQPEKLAT